MSESGGSAFRHGFCTVATNTLNTRKQRKKPAGNAHSYIQLSIKHKRELQDNRPSCDDQDYGDNDDISKKKTRTVIQ